MDAHEIHYPPQRFAPLLVGPRILAAAAIGSPSLDSVRTAPGRRRIYRDLAARLMSGKIGVTVGHHHVIALIENPDGTREFGGARAFMMAEGFSVRSDHKSLPRFQRQG